MNLEMILEEILRHPERDELRKRYAELVQTADPHRAEFVELQLKRALPRRESLVQRWVDACSRERRLLDDYEKKWSFGVGEFCSRVEFDRGFIASITINPQVFLSKGHEILRRAPIQHISVISPMTRDQKLLVEISQSPLMSSMSSIELVDWDLSDEDIEMLASSPCFERCLYLDLSGSPLGRSAFHSLARSEMSRKILIVNRFAGGGYSYDPAQQCHREIPDGVGLPYQESWLPLGPDGQSFEREFGYIPWLHPQDNACDKFDARYFVEQGILPKRPPGSPVEQ